MERCLDCNSLLTKEETVCIECGTKVHEEDKSAAAFVSTIVTALFYISALIMVASPFIDRLPSFTFCILITSALLFVSRTAKESVQKIKRR
jgi:hypothetical protein